MDIRLFKTWVWIPISNDVYGAQTLYQLASKDTLQYKAEGMTDWKDVPIVEDEKPEHPDDIKRKTYMKEINDLLNKQ